MFAVARRLGADPQDQAPFAKYAKAAESLLKPSSAARAVAAGAPFIERVDLLVKLISHQLGAPSADIDRTVEIVDQKLNEKIVQGGSGASWDAREAPIYVSIVVTGHAPDRSSADVRSGSTHRAPLAIAGAICRSGPGGQSPPPCVEMSRFDPALFSKVDHATSGSGSIGRARFKRTQAP
jgi:hypothetical protein